MKKISLGALALTLTAGLVGAAAPAQAGDPVPVPPGADVQPRNLAANYLIAQLGSSHILKTYYDFPVGLPYESYDDYGLTIDAAWALEGAGGHVLERQATTAALEANIANYAFTGGSKSKMAAYLLSQGVDNGATEDLVTDIETNHLGAAAPIVGRLIDADDPMTAYDDDFNSPLTQAFAVSALNNGGSDQADEALDFLLDQQCTPGYFRASFSAKDAVDQTCDGAGTPASSVDTTATAVLMLQDQKSKPKVKSAIKLATAWLKSTQDVNGSWGDNANATGLAGWVLSLDLSGDSYQQAGQAAYWLRQHQLANAGECTPFAEADNGAVVLDDLGYTNAKAGALDPLDTSVAVRATAQALPALAAAPGQGVAQGVRSGETTVTGPEGFLPAGSTQQLTIAGAPGNSVCVMKGTSPFAPDTKSLVVLDADGRATEPLVVPQGTGVFAVATEDAGFRKDTLVFRFLGKTTFDVSARPVVKKGNLVKVLISGGVKGETVTVTLGNKKVVTTFAGNGRAHARIAVQKLGKQRLKAVGEFANRKGKTRITATA